MHACGVLGYANKFYWPQRPWKLVLENQTCHSVPKIKKSDVILWFYIIDCVPKEISTLNEKPFSGYSLSKVVPYSPRTDPLCPRVTPCPWHYIRFNTYVPITNIAHKEVGNNCQTRTDMWPICYSLIWHQEFYRRSIVLVKELITLTWYLLSAPPLWSRYVCYKNGQRNQGIYHTTKLFIDLPCVWQSYFIIT